MTKKVIAALIVLGLGTAALSTCSKGGPFKHKGAGMFKVMKQLDLTSEQKKQMKALKEERKVHMKSKMKEMRKNRKSMMTGMKPDLSTFMTANSFDKKAFKVQMKKKFEEKRKMIESKKSEMLNSRADSMEKVFNILTAEQRVKWIELSKQINKD
jgi:protein CpxP